MLARLRVDITNSCGYNYERGCKRRQRHGRWRARVAWSHTTIYRYAALCAHISVNRALHASGVTCLRREHFAKPPGLAKTRSVVTLAKRDVHSGTLCARAYPVCATAGKSGLPGPLFLLLHMLPSRGIAARGNQYFFVKYQ